MVRWHSVGDQRAMRKRVRYILKSRWGRIYQADLGRYRDFHPAACRRARCGLCHWEKNYESRRRAANRRAAIKFELNAY